MVECLVEYEYVAQEEDELTIRPGDVLSNVQKQDGGWWEGEINGRKGMFPDNFVKEVKQEVKKAAPESNHRASVKKVGGPGGGGHVAELANRLGKEGAIRIGPPAPGGLKREISQGKRQQRVKVTFSYSPENDDELRLEVGEIVTVTKQEEEGWWEGILNGKQGMFPSNFVEAIDEDGGGETTSGDELNTPEVEIHGKKVKGVGLGNIFSAGPIKLRSTSKDNPSAVKRAPTSPKAPVPKEPVPHENEKRDSLKRTSAPAEPPPSLPPKDQPTVKPFLNNYGHAVPYKDLDEDPDANESSHGSGYSPGGIVIEDGVIKGKKCASPPSDFSLPELDIASPESSCSLDLGKGAVLSNSSFSSSGPGSARSENQSDDVPFELSALSQTRHTPPPSFTQFNFRKRRSRGTPKNSPKLDLLVINELNQKTQKTEKPPKKVAKLVGTSISVENQAVMTDECPAIEMTTTESQTDAQYVEDENVNDLTPQNVVIKAMARSISEPCLTTTKKSVSFVTRDNYISDAEDETDAIQISEEAKKRMARAKRRFPSRGMIDGSKIADSLRLLRLRLGMDPDNPQTEGDGSHVELGDQVEVKAKSRRLSTIKNKFIRKIASSPVRTNKVKATEGTGRVTALSNVNIGDTGIQVTEDNCSTTAMRGSPLSTRSSSVIEVDDTSSKTAAREVIPKRSDSGSKEAWASSMPALTTESAQASPPVYKKPFFTFSLGRKKGKKVKILQPESPGPTTDLEKNRDLSKKSETSYFQTLDDLGKMSPAIKNIGSKYKLFSNKNMTVAPDQEVEGNVDTSEDLITSRKNSNLFLNSFQDVVQNKEAASEEQQHENRAEAAQVEKNESAAQMATPYTEPEVDLVPSAGGIYAPNEGDQNRPLVKRTKKSTNIAIDKNVAVEVRERNEKKSSAQKKKPIKKSNSITQRLRRIWSSRDKVTRHDDEEPGDEICSQENIEQNSQKRRAKLSTSSDTVTSKTVADQDNNMQRRSMLTKSEGTLIHPIPAEASSSDEDDQEKPCGTDSPKNINQNCDNVPLDAIFMLQNFVHSFTQSEADVSHEAADCPDHTGNSVPQIKRVDISDKTSAFPSGRVMAEPYLESEDANLDYPSPVGKSLRSERENRDQLDMEITGVNGGKQEIEPRRIVPTRILVEQESMQTEAVEEENNKQHHEGPKTDGLVSGVVMHCQTEEPTEVFRPYGGFSDSICISDKQRSRELDNLFIEPEFLGGGRKMDPMKMDTCEYLDDPKRNQTKNVERSTKNLKWSRCNSAPPGSLRQNEQKRSCFPYSNLSFDEPNDGSLDKWDLMKVILEETETVFKPSFVTINGQNVRRPFDYDESFSTGSSCSTDSADEAAGMETGDCEPEINTASDSSSNGSIDPVIRSFYASDDDLYGSAPVSSPCDQQLSSHPEISMSSLNDSLSLLKAAGDRGGSGEKRKKCEVGTPTKDENVGRKVRLESPASDEEGPPRARRVLRSGNNPN